MTETPGSKPTDLQLSLGVLLAVKGALVKLGGRIESSSRLFEDYYSRVVLHTAVELVDGLVSEISAKRHQNAARLCRHILELELEDAYVRSIDDGLERWRLAYAVRWRRSLPAQSQPPGPPFDVLWDDAEARRGLPHYQTMADELGRGRWWRYWYGRLSRVAHPGFGGLSAYIQPASGLTPEDALRRLEQGDDPNGLLIFDPTRPNEELLDTIATRAHGALSHLGARISARLDEPGQ